MHANVFSVNFPDMACFSSFPDIAVMMISIDLSQQMLAIDQFGKTWHSKTEFEWRLKQIFEVRKLY